MRRIRRGFRLLQVSWEVLRADRELMVLPLMALGCMTLTLAVFVGGALRGGLLDVTMDPSLPHYVALGLFYFVTSFIGIYFQAALVGAATIRLEGGDPTVRDGLRRATEVIDKILAWALVSASVGIVLQTIQRYGRAGRAIGDLLGSVWAALTYFVVPVMLYEPHGVRGSFKRSTRLFKERWGELFTGNASISAALFLVLLPVVFACVLIAVAQPIVGIPLTLFVVGGLIVMAQAVSGIFNAALYRFATTGEALGGFSENDLRGAFSRPGRRSSFGRRTERPDFNEHFGELLAQHNRMTAAQPPKEPI